MDLSSKLREMESKTILRMNATLTGYSGDLMSLVSLKLINIYDILKPICGFFAMRLQKIELFYEMT